MAMKLDKEKVVPVLEAAGFSQTNNTIWMIEKEGTPYGVDFAKNSIFRFEDMERITADKDDAYLNTLKEMCVGGTVKGAAEEKQQTCEICRNPGAQSAKYGQILCSGCEKKANEHGCIPPAVLIVGWEAYEEAKQAESNLGKEEDTPGEQSLADAVQSEVPSSNQNAVVSYQPDVLPPLCTADIVRPAVTAAQAAAAWNEFQQLKVAVIDKSDLQKIGTTDYVKKSGWRKLAQYFNLTDDIIEETCDKHEGGEGWTWTVKVRCIAANGRTTVGVGKCSTSERKFAHVEHDTYATAHTRAKNRAISDMIAAGEVSAEEVRA